MQIHKIPYLLKILCCIHISLLTVFMPTQANELSDNLSGNWSDKLNFNGFFTLDYTATSNDLNLISNSDQHVRYQANEPSFKNSLIGGQLSYQLTDNFAAVVQGKLYDDTDSDSTSNSDSIAQIDWAYLSYDFGYDVKIRAGRFQIPFMQGVELRNVSFSRLWVRPLIPSSGAGGFKEYIGGEALKHISSGESNWDFQVAIGKAEHALDEIENKNIKLLSVRFQQNSFWLRTSVLATQYSISTKTGRVINDSADGLMLSLESEYALGSYLFNAGYSTSRADITPDDSNYYLSIAYQYNDITPYIYHSRFNQFFEPYRRQEATQSPQVNSQGAATPVQRDGNIDVYNWAVGAKYLFNEQYAIKVQAEHIKERNNASLPFVNSEGNAFSIVFEGVF